MGEETLPFRERQTHMCTAHCGLIAPLSRRRKCMENHAGRGFRGRCLAVARILELATHDFAFNACGLTSTWEVIAGE